MSFEGHLKEKGVGDGFQQLVEEMRLKYNKLDLAGKMEVFGGLPMFKLECKGL